MCIDVVQYREKNIPFSTVASGFSFAEDFGSVVHVGMDDKKAGEEIAKQLKEIISGSNPISVACIDHMQQTDISVSERCSGVKQAIEDMGGNVAIISVDGTNPGPARVALKSQLETFENNQEKIDGVVAVGELGTTLLIE